MKTKTDREQDFKLTTRCFCKAFREDGLRNQSGRATEKLFWSNIIFSATVAALKCNGCVPSVRLQDAPVENKPGLSIRSSGIFQRYKCNMKWANQSRTNSSGQSFRAADRQSASCLLLKWWSHTQVVARTNKPTQCSESVAPCFHENKKCQTNNVTYNLLLTHHHIQHFYIHFHIRSKYIKL